MGVGSTLHSGSIKQSSEMSRKRFCGAAVSRYIMTMCENSLTQLKLVSFPEINVVCDRGERCPSEGGTPPLYKSLSELRRFYNICNPALGTRPHTTIDTPYPMRSTHKLIETSFVLVNILIMSSSRRQRAMYQIVCKCTFRSPGV